MHYISYKSFETKHQWVQFPLSFEKRSEAEAWIRKNEPKYGETKWRITTTSS
jgi:hypothetical protein